MATILYFQPQKCMNLLLFYDFYHFNFYNTWVFDCWSDKEAVWRCHLGPWDVVTNMSTIFWCFVQRINQQIKIIVSCSPTTGLKERERQCPFCTLLFGKKETLVIIRFPLTVNVAKLQNNVNITKHTQLPTDRPWSHPHSCCSAEDQICWVEVACCI